MSPTPTPDLERLKTPLVHLYRGELGRMTTYRVRLDTTTNWAVGTNAALMSLVLSDHVLSVGALFPVAFAINGVFVWMEARRYRAFEMSRARVRLLETGFYARELGAPEAAPSDWIKQLRDSLTTPEPPLGYLEALSVRLRRNYMWILGANYLAWAYGILRAGGVAGADVGPIPGIVMVILGLLVLPPTLILAFMHSAPEEG